MRMALPWSGSAVEDEEDKEPVLREGHGCLQVWAPISLNLLSDSAARGNDSAPSPSLMGTRLIALLERDLREVENQLPRRR